MCCAAAKTFWPVGRNTGSCARAHSAGAKRTNAAVVTPVKRGLGEGRVPFHRSASARQPSSAGRQMGARHSGAASGRIERSGSSGVRRCGRRSAEQRRAQQAGAAEEVTGVRVPPAGPAACQTFYVVIIGGRATTGATQARKQHAHTEWQTQINTEAKTLEHTCMQHQTASSGRTTRPELTTDPYCRRTPWTARSACSAQASMHVPPQNTRSIRTRSSSAESARTMPCGVRERQQACRLTTAQRLSPRRPQPAAGSHRS
jgi:hypothetical protein